MSPQWWVTLITKQCSENLIAHPGFYRATKTGQAKPIGILVRLRSAAWAQVRRTMKGETDG